MKARPWTYRVRFELLYRTLCRDGSTRGRADPVVAPRPGTPRRPEESRGGGWWAPLRRCGREPGVGDSLAGSGRALYLRTKSWLIAPTTKTSDQGFPFYSETLGHLE